MDNLLDGICLANLKMVTHIELKIIIERWLYAIKRYSVLLLGNLNSLSGSNKEARWLTTIPLHHTH